MGEVGGGGLVAFVEDVSRPQSENDDGGFGGESGSEWPARTGQERINAKIHVRKLKVSSRANINEVQPHERQTLPIDRFKSLRGAEIVSISVAKPITRLTVHQNLSPAITLTTAIPNARPR